ncbi:hypothetical protein GDO81_015627 [Engystomops pustulosus]|uniref:Uncharacterized protein n=1 Tax=Engystomops pustulosus TaxID=76066 RepID=A0AAV7AQK3_ENGPU|nr:hypothetical protein GDO81_015627 [Engystomops pustulosus]
MSAAPGTSCVWDMNPSIFSSSAVCKLSVDPCLQVCALISRRDLQPLGVRDRAAWRELGKAHIHAETCLMEPPNMCCLFPIFLL